MKRGFFEALKTVNLLCSHSYSRLSGFSSIAQLRKEALQFVRDLHWSNIHHKSKIWLTHKPDCDGEGFLFYFMFVCDNRHLSVARKFRYKLNFTTESMM